MKKKNKKKQLATFNKKNLKSAILSVMYDDPAKPANYRQISSVLGIKDDESKKLITVVLEELHESGYLEQTSRGKYRLRTKGGFVTGVVKMQPTGYAYVHSEEADAPVYISAGNLLHAMTEDKVKVHLFARRKGHDLEGEVVEILERAKKSFVGIVELARDYAFLIPSGKTSFDIFIPSENLKGVKNGQKAIAEITEWPVNAKNPMGIITEVLGDAGKNETEMHAILAEFGLPLKFPEKVEKAAEKIAVEIPRQVYKIRRDCREIPTFTIDPEDAKDFDDALSLRKLADGILEIGVHIADVTYYVKQNTILEEEAYERGTSVYLVDRVVPMLPEKLSNGVCSLSPHQDKLCFSAIFEMNENGRIIKEWFGKTVINSDRRFSYEEAQQILETGQGELSEELQVLNRIAGKLRGDRFKAGSIAFDRVEIKFNLDENGKPLSVFFKETKDSNRLIEEFMLLANRRVAEIIGNPGDKKAARVYVYRIHDRPDPEKLENFNHFIHQFGWGIQLVTPKSVAESMNTLLVNVKGRREQNVVENLAVRTMAKAEYSTRNIGHYGLAFDYYTHFTSPIRRYPDMMVHRLLEKYLEGGRTVSAVEYEEKCRHSSDMETRAANAERASVKYKQVEFMEEHLGEIYAGVISGVTDWGLYVELQNKIEGMIPIRELDDDFYVFDEKNYLIRGRHSGKVFQLGDPVRVKIWRTNLEKKQLDFLLADEQNNNHKELSEK
jgi:ribonuclease R